MRRLAAAVCIALLAWSALASSATCAWAQEDDAPPDEQPAEIDVDAPIPRPQDTPRRRGMDVPASAPVDIEPTGTTTVEFEEYENGSYFLSALFFGALVVVIILLLVAVVLLVVGVTLLAVAIGIVVAVGTAALALGLASTSTFVGWTRRSFGAGFTALLAQAGAVGGLPCGVAISWIAFQIARDELALDVSRDVCLVLGGVSGLAAGAILGLLTARAVRLTASWARTKLPPDSSA